MTRLQDWRVAAATQIAGGLALFLSFWIPPLTLVGLAPAILLAGTEMSRWKRGVAAWLGGAAFFFPGVQWLRYCDDSAWLGWLLLATYLSLYLPAFVWLVRRMTGGGLPILAAAPAAWVCLEYVRMHLMTGFGWLLLAHSTTTWIPMIQIADFGGVYAVSLLLALFNACFVEALKGRWKLAALAASGCAVAAAGYGAFRLRTSEFSNGPTVLLVQTNLPQRLKLDNADETYAAVEKATLPTADLTADLVVWPETSYPFIFGDYDPTHSDERLMNQYRLRFGAPAGRLADYPDSKLAAFFRDAIDSGNRHLSEVSDKLAKPLLVSVLRYELREPKPAMYNSAVLFAPGKGRVATYDKLHLVPFGEYVPLKDWLPILRVLLPYDTETMGVDAGERFDIVAYGKLSFAATICFEDTLPHIGRGFMRSQTANRRVDFFVSQCNDGWFQGSVEGDLHLAASVYRCIECRRAMVRSANMCVTAAIDPAGRVFASLPKHAETHLKAIVPIDRRETLYVRFGDWLPQTCSLIVMAGVVAGMIRRRTAPPQGVRQ